MKYEELNSLFIEFAELQQKTLEKKGSDYSSEDSLSNFKTVAAILGTTPEFVAAVLIGVKLARLGVLLNTVHIPQNESLQDSVLDMANYSFLLKACLVEKEASFAHAIEPPD